MKKKKEILTETPTKKLSLKRLAVTVVFIAGFIYVSYLGVNRAISNVTSAPIDPWFGPYVDVTATPRYEFEQNEVIESQKNLVLSFIVSLRNDPCKPSWGGVYTLDQAGASLDLDRRIERFRQSGGEIAISFGGQLNDEISLFCEDEEKLLNAYESVIERYEVDTIDLDLEGKGLTDKAALERRAGVISELQKKFKDKNKNLAVWLTLPVTTQGLTEDGTNAVSAMLNSSVDLSGVNAMIMNYGESREDGSSMFDASKSALAETHRQLGILYTRAGKSYSSSTLWTKIGATPMIGQNDVYDEVFTLEDAGGVNEFALSKGISRMSMWSANRDITCGDNYTNTSRVSDSCSGVVQKRFDFAGILGAEINGNISSNASVETEEEIVEEPVTDDPKTSPYQIWKKSGTYLQGKKVVWHGNVYQAKWWTSGDLPDNPVLQSWETPWKLIGPVLPGEKPVALPTLPPGIYPTWSGTEIYEAGQRIIFNGVPYLAKWWTQGDSPAASSSNPDSSPWVLLTQEQINDAIDAAGY